MFKPHVDVLMRELRPSEQVLDVGGWACPFNRAQWILDAEPYETRGYYRTFNGPAFQGGAREWFDKSTWVQRDICDREPWPFADKQFDFAICSHTLEDIRDPLWVCSELVRVGKRGYVEVPSREWETCRGVERSNMAGLSHHRWLIDIEENRIAFIHKFHLLHSHWKFSFPASRLNEIPPERAVQWLWWDGSFEYEERTIHGVDQIEAELAGYVERIAAYPAWRLRAMRMNALVRHFGVRVRNKMRQFARA